MLNDKIDVVVLKYIIEKLDHRNILSYYNFARMFHLPEITEEASNYIERRFIAIAKTQNFLEFDFVIVNKILASSGLLVSSEVQIFDIANSWISYNTTQRSRFAKNILLKVRFPLLSDHALEYVLRKKSSFNDVKDCSLLVKEILLQKRTFFQTKSILYFTNRYCSQNMFDLLLCGGYKRKQSSNQIEGHFKVLSPMVEKRCFFKSAYLNDEVYFFGGCDCFGPEHEHIIETRSVEKFSLITNACEKVAEMPVYREEFCVCAFMGNIYIIGGVLYPTGSTIDHWCMRPTNTCLRFDTNGNEWKQIAGMNGSRLLSACSVFGGKIVVSGGTPMEDTVEMYDHVADTWSFLPNMLQGRELHASVAVRNKLYVFGGQTATCEVFDADCNKFVFIKPPPTLISPFTTPISYGLPHDCFAEAFSIGSTIFVFDHESPITLCYDLVEEEWFEETCEMRSGYDSYFCVKAPKLKQ